MIPAQYYYNIYLAIVTILTIILSLRYSNFGNSRLNQDQQENNNRTGYLIALAFSLFIGFRPFSFRFVDMMNYRENYYGIVYGRIFNFDWGAENFIFDNIFAWFGSKYFEIGTLIAVISLGYFIFAYKAMTLFFKKDALYAFVVWLGAFSTFSYATNGIKAGLAASVFLCALAYRYKPIKAAILLIVCWGLHHSMILPIAAYIACCIVKNTKCYLYFWFFAMAVAFLHISAFQQLFSGMADESGAAYLTSTGKWGGKTGFRFDFIFYSALPVVVGYYAIFKRGFRSQMYNFLYNCYLLTNAVWMLCMYAAFTNRIAYLSWAFLPVVTMYPFFTKEFIPLQYKYTNYVVWYQLAFTLAMAFIYYA